jgi:hypothetical protein
MLGVILKNVILLSVILLCVILRIAILLSSRKKIAYGTFTRLHQIAQRCDFDNNFPNFFKSVSTSSATKRTT